MDTRWGVQCTVSKNRSFGFQKSSFRILILNGNMILQSFDCARKKKNYLFKGCLVMVLKRSLFEIQKQRTKNFNDPSYGCGAIHENVPKLRNCAKRRNFRTFS